MFIPADTYNTGIPVQWFPTLTFNAIEDDTLYVEVCIDNRELSDSLRVFVDATSSFVPNHNILENVFGLHTLPYDSVDLIFGPLYRRWGQFGYNFLENDNAAPDVMIEEDLLRITFPTFDMGDLGDYDTGSEDDADALEADTLIFGNPLATAFMPMYVLPDSGAWYCYDEYTYIGPDSMSSSRLGEDDVSFLDTLDPVTGGPSLLGRGHQGKLE
ncbi:MAG: hypothetical protein IPI72_12260 [Flavobacteriales bacterium]|nr:hypothetical protein [Flavobacteriales bacterium]